MVPSVLFLRISITWVMMDVSGAQSLVTVPFSGPDGVRSHMSASGLHTVARDSSEAVLQLRIFTLDLLVWASFDKHALAFMLCDWMHPWRVATLLAKPGFQLFYFTAFEHQFSVAHETCPRARSSFANDAYRAVEYGSGMCKAGFAEDDFLRAVEDGSDMCKLGFMTMLFVTWKTAVACARLGRLMAMPFAPLNTAVAWARLGLLMTLIALWKTAVVCARLVLLMVMLLTLWEVPSSADPRSPRRPNGHGRHEPEGLCQCQADCRACESEDSRAEVSAAAKIGGRRVHNVARHF